MSDIAKWALLGAGIIAVLLIILAFPIFGVIDASEFSSMMGSFVTSASSFLRFGRGLFNNFLTPYGRTLLTVILSWFLLKPFVMLGAKTTVMVYKWIFK